MNTKKIRLMLWAVIIVLLGGIAALGITLYNHMQPVDGSEVIAGVEWYDQNEKEFVIQTVDEMYDIAKLSEFCDFKGQTIKLGADLVFNEGNAEDWREEAPERTWDSIRGFSGIFDGQGHTISGLYSKGYNDNAGLFKNPTNVAVIQDFKIVNSYFESIGASGLGSVASGMQTGGTFRKIYSNVILVSDSDNVGGIAGEIKKDATIEECWFDGQIEASGWCLGGIIGEARSTKKLSVSHCLVTGEINSIYQGPNKYEASRVGGIIGYLRQTGSPVATFDDCFVDAKLTAKIEKPMASIAAYLDIKTNTTFSNMYATTNTHVNTYTKAAAETSVLTGTVLAFDKEEISGSSAYEWVTLDFENYWIAVEGDTPKLKYFSDASSAIDLTNVKRKFDDTWFDKTKSEYILTTNEQLFGLSLISSMKNETFKGKTVKLGNDLTLNKGDAATWAEKTPEIEWLPIGNFHGTFDGQGHTVSGLYADGTDRKLAMFGSTQAGAVIKNFSLKNSFFRITNNSLGANTIGLGSVIGTMADATLENVYSNAIVINAGESGLGTGGLVGNVSISQKNAIINCWFDGYVESAFRANGGIIGYVSNGKLDILHCLNTGDVYKKYNNTASRSGNFVGDITGWSVNTTVTIEDCMATGKIITDNPNQVGSVVGFMQGNPAKEKTAVLKGNNVFVANEAFKRTTGTIAKGAIYSLSPCVMSEKEWVGYDGYVKTTLDFAKYWAVQTDSTPILKMFASKVPSLAGIKRWDISWYDESKNAFVLKDKYDLYGFALLTTMGNDFAGKTVTLGNIITINEGNAKDWDEKAPAENWLAIQKFAGTFDGKGHTISGIYLKNELDKQGLFGSTTKTAVVKNFRLTNSYFETNAVGIASNGSNALGSVIGSASGKLEDVYSDAIVVSKTQKGEAGTGGLVGYGSNVEIIGCWFDGSVTSDWRGNAGIVGYISNSTALIKNCLNSGTIHQTIKEQPARTAGIVGEVLEWSVETVVTIEDCLNVGKITHVNPNQVGAILGYTSGNKNKNAYPVVNGSNVYKTTESHARVSGATIETVVINMREADLIGYNGYIKTTLDFDNYWAVDINGSPILKKFAGSVPSLAGIERYDISWYDDNKNEFILTTEAQFNGLSLLTAMGKDFTGKTVTLGEDMHLNSGTPTKATDWATYLTNHTPNTWMPIVNFAGTFDGNNKEISGVYVDATDAKQGLFGSTTKTAVIKNFNLVNSYFTTNASGIASNESMSLGSVAGYGEGKFRHIYSNAVVVNTTQKGNGGTGGIVGSSSGKGLEIVDCWFDGEITSNWNGIGGILGYASNTKVDILHCLNSGILKQTLSSQPARTGGMVGYVLEWSVETEVKIEDSLNVGQITCVNPNQSGSISGYTSGNSNTGAMPVISGSNVYATSESHGRLSGSTIALKPTAIGADTIKGYGAYKWTDLDFENCWAVVLDGTPVLQTFADDIPELTNIVKPDTSWYIDDAAGREYTLDTVEELFGFAYKAQSVNFDEQTIKLGADIIVNANAPKTKAAWTTYLANNQVEEWVSIGNESLGFSGTFDGDGHTISGVYLNTSTATQGLFGAIDGGIVRELNLENSYFVTSQSTLGSIVGRTINSSIISVYSNAILESNYANEYGRVGGISGQIDTGTVTINDCWFDGDINSAGGKIGGIVGRVAAVNANITNCLNTGNITNNFAGTSGGLVDVGGLIGGRNNNANTPVTLSNCFNAGTLTLNGGTVTAGVAIGSMYWNGSVTISNVYTESDKAIVNGVEKSFTVASGTKASSVTNLTATKVSAYTTSNVALDYTEHWMLVHGDIPRLRSHMIDISWYEDATAGKTYTLSTAEEFFGFAWLSQTKNFANQTVELDADITFNEGTPTTYAEWQTYLTTNTPKQWLSIGYGQVPFAGRFDGKGHTISGIYMANLTSDCQGLFQATAAGSWVGNFRLENSYVSGDIIGLGSVIGRAVGTFDQIYSNAVVVKTSNSDKSGTGGIIGIVNWAGSATITNSQFDGYVHVKYNNGGGIAGAVAGSGKTLSMTNCINTGTVAKDDTVVQAARIGGLCGYVSAGTLNITDCVNAGVASTTYQNQSGSLVGRIDEGASVVMNDVYGISDTWTKGLIGQGSSYVSGTYSSTPIAKANLLGELAKTNASGLDWANSWEIVENGLPIPKLVPKKRTNQSN